MDNAERKERREERDAEIYKKFPQLDLRINPNKELIDNYFESVSPNIRDDLREKGINLSDCLFKIYISIVAHGMTLTTSITYPFNVNITSCAAQGKPNSGNETTRSATREILKSPVDYSSSNLKNELFLKGATSETIFKIIARKRNVAYPDGLLQDALLNPILPPEIEETANDPDIQDPSIMKRSALGRLSILNDPNTFQSYTTNTYPEKQLQFSNAPNNVFRENPGIIAYLNVYENNGERLLQYEIPIMRQFKANGDYDIYPITLSKLIYGLHYLSEKFNKLNTEYNKGSIGITVLDSSCSVFSKKVDANAQYTFKETVKSDLQNKGRQLTIQELSNAIQQNVQENSQKTEAGTQSQETEAGTQEYGGKNTKRTIKSHKRRTHKKKHTKRKRIIKRITKRRHNKSNKRRN
jgi:hypothetical protein